jgi:hypothetical protein
MGRLLRAMAALCVALQLAACAGSAAIESQTRQRDGRLARIYLLREKGIIGALGGTAATADVKVDGKTVGALRNGFYIFVDRPPGLHTLSAQTGISMAFETEVQVEAGQVYYFDIGAPTGGGPGHQLASQLYAGGSGEVTRPKSMLSGGFSGVALYRLDPAAGAAILEQLQAP